MIYVIKSGTSIKVGYSKDVDKRLKAYRTHNPDIELLKVESGERSLEKYIHKQLKEYKLRDEWFDYTPEAIAIIERCFKVRDEVKPKLTMTSKLIYMNEDDTELLEEVEIIHKIYHKGPRVWTHEDVG